jgi:hypothetical protein
MFRSRVRQKADLGSNIAKVAAVQGRKAWRYGGTSQCTAASVPICWSCTSGSRVYQENHLVDTLHWALSPAAGRPDVCYLELIDSRAE